MPAALPPSNTQRWFVDYQQGTYQHTLVVRGSPTATQETVDANVTTFLTAIGTEFVESHIIGVRHAAVGSDVTLPVESGLIGDSFGSGPTTAYHSATAVSFTGRSENGHKWRVSVFGYKNALGDYRLQASEATWVFNGIAALDAAFMSFVVIDGGQPIINAYANLGVNDHWLKKARGS